MLLTYPLMVAIQEISARIGRVTGHGIADNVCRNFPAPAIWFLIVVLFIANTVNIAADLGAMADSLKLANRESFGSPRRKRRNSALIATRSPRSATARHVEVAFEASASSRRSKSAQTR